MSDSVNCHTCGARGDASCVCIEQLNWPPTSQVPERWGPCHPQICVCWRSYDVGGFFHAVAIAGALAYERQRGMTAGWDAHEARTRGTATVAQVRIALNILARKKGDGL